MSTIRKSQLPLTDMLHAELVWYYFKYLSMYNERVESIGYLTSMEITSKQSFVKEYSKIKMVMKLFPLTNLFVRSMEASISTKKKMGVVQ